MDVRWHTTAAIWGARDPIVPTVQRFIAERPHIWAEDIGEAGTAGRYRHNHSGGVG